VLLGAVRSNLSLGFDSGSKNQKPNIEIMLLSCFLDGLSQETAAGILVLTSSASRDVANLCGQFWEVTVRPSLEAL
jgi:hypothetical protein